MYTYYCYIMTEYNHIFAKTEKVSPALPNCIGMVSILASIVN